MGLDISAYNFIAYCCKNQAKLGTTLTLGRQNNFTNWINPSSGKQEEYCEPILITKFGASRVDSVDASGYEKATFVQDLNLEWTTKGLATNRYDSIIDLGTLEHVFNVPQALESIAKACEIGGQIIHVQTHADFCGHGFWQFSAELFFSWYSKANGFSNVEIFIAPLHELRYWFRCTRPNTGERCELSNKKVPHSYILVRALKEADVNHRCCQQSDYIEKWSKVDDLNDQANQKSAKTFMQTVKDVIPTPIKQNLKSFKENLAPWWKTPYISRETVANLIQ